MATRTDQIIGPITLPITRDIRHDTEFDNQQVVERIPQVEHDGMAYLSSTDGGFEPEVAGFIQNAWKPSTRKQYAAVWKQWSAWCGRKGINATTPSAVNLVKYLWHLYK